MFQSYSKDRHLFIEITDGEITQVVEDGGYSQDPFIRSKPQIDSPDALKLALKNDPDLKMSFGKGRGYDFDLQIGFSGEPEINISGSKVVGTEYKNAYVKINPQSSDIR